MSRINKVRQRHSQELEKHSIKNDVSLLSIKRLLDAEKTKKLLKRNTLIQQTIDREIDNAVANENH